MAIQSNFPSIRPSLLLDFANSKRLDPRVTFSRASTATYYDGVTVAKAEENLLLQSQAFDDSSWTKGNVTVSADAGVAPDGTSTADLMYPSSTGTFRTVRQSAVVARAYSVFVKASGMSWAAIGVGASLANYTFFDVSTGVVGTTSTRVSSATITSVGSGWYRCNLVFNADESDIRIGVSDADGSTTATASGTNGILLWGAQAELRTAVTAYTATTTQAITNYVPKLQTAAANVARFDHNPVTGASLGLLAEAESRQNLFTYSDDFANAAWTKTRSSITSNTIIAPDGTLTGDKLVEDTTASNNHIFEQPKGTVGATETLSIYAKAGERTWIRLILGASNNAFFNLATGAVGTVTGTTTTSIIAVGNGWYRCAISAVRATNTNNFVALASADNTPNYTGDGYSGAYIWGAQLETGAFATSYIPTVASAVTRSADIGVMTGTNFSSWYRADEGTLYCDSTGGGGGTLAAVYIGDGTGNNRLFVAGAFSGTSGAPAVITTNNSAQTAFTSVTFAAQNKVAMAYKVNDIAVSVNGATAQTDTSAVIPVASQLRLRDSGLAVGSGHIGKLAYYPLRLADAQLQAITG